MKLPMKYETGKFSTLLTVLRAGAPDVIAVTLAVSVSLLEVGSTLWFPILTKNLIDRLTAASTSGWSLISNPTVQLLVVVIMVGAGAGAVSSYLLANAGLRVVANLKTEIVQHLMSQRVSYFDDQRSGELVSRITNDTDVIARVATTDLQNLVSGLLMLAGSAIILAFLDIQLTLAIFGIVVGAFLLMAPIMTKMAGITRRINDANASLTAALTRTFGEIRLVKASTAEQTEETRSISEINRLLRANNEAAKVQSSLQPFMSMALTLALLAIFAYGGSRVQLGTLSIGTLTAFILSIFNIISPLIQLSMVFAHLHAAKGASVRIAEILSVRGENTTSGNAIIAKTDAASDKDDLTFTGVRLTYEGASQATIDIDRLVFAAGRSTVMVGASGSGKTSIFSLIERFYEPNSGSISIGNADIRDIPLRHWRGRLGYVSQAAPLMAGTIRENIEYGAPNSTTFEAVKAAADAANCLEFIMASSHGFDTQVGDAGIRMSGGQKQRIAIARMFVRNPKILLLDEATSNLDEESESLVLSAIKRLMIGRTTIVSTHRLSTIASADFVAVIEGGRLVEFGSSQQVIANSPYLERIKLSRSVTPRFDV